MNIMNQKRKKVIDMYYAGLPFSEIAKETGYKEASVRSILSQEGVCYRKKMHDKKHAEVIRLCNEGVSNTNISKITGYSEGTISRILIQYGIRRYVKHDAYEEDDIDTDTLQFAVERKPKFERVICNGKEYTDITDAIVGS